MCLDRMYEDGKTESRVAWISSYTRTFTRLFAGNLSLLIPLRLRVQVSCGVGNWLNTPRLPISNAIVSRFAPGSVQNEENRDSWCRGCVLATEIRMDSQ